MTRPGNHGSTRSEYRALQADARQWFEKLVNQNAGRRYRGRKLSDADVTARFYKAVTDAHLGHILKVDLTAETFNYYVLDQLRWIAPG